MLPLNKTQRELNRMLTLVKYETRFKSELENYPLSEEQLVFTGHPLELLARAEETPTYTPIIILDDDKVAGFFVLDTGEDRFINTEEVDSILLRGYSIHPAFQGRGIAKTSLKLLAEYFSNHYPQVNHIVLGVNEANKAAQALYFAMGFVDDGKRFYGRSGMQLALSLHLKEVIIRKAIPGDEQGIVDVCVAGQWNTYKHLYSPQYIEQIIHKFYTIPRIQKEIIETNRDWNGYYVAVLDNRIIGAIGGGVDEEGIAEVYVLYLDPTKRTQGVGTMLLNYLTIVQRKKYRAYEQWVSVTKGNKLGIPFYVARGFIYQSETQETGDEVASLRYKRGI